MKNTKKNVIALLERMSVARIECADYIEIDNAKLADDLRREAYAFRECIRLMTDEHFFTEMWNIR